MLNRLSKYISSNPIGQIFNLGRKTVEWKKVTDLEPGMKIAIADSEVEFDEIVSIRPVGQEQVYDIEVENTHNFIGNGIVAHNTIIAGNVTPEATGTRDLGSSSLYWNNLYANNIYAPSSGTSGYWQRNSGALSPVNITDDLLLGTTATSSALVKLPGISGGNVIFNSGGSVGIGTTAPASTALLDLTSTTKGFLAPRMTTTQRDAIVSPASGLFVYNTTTNAYNVYNGSTWGAVGGGGGAWSDLTAPTANLSLAMGTYTTGFNWATGTAANNLFSFTTDASSNGTGSLINLQTGTSSTVSPLRVRAGATEALFVNSSGNVGIGTTSITNKLDVNGVVAGTYFVDYSNNAYGLDPAGTANFGGYSMQITGGALLAVDSGNVGIGSATPTAKLDVAGTASVSGILSLASSIGTQRMTTMNIGNSTTGNIVIDSGSNAITLSDNVTLTTGSVTSSVADSATAVGFTLNTASMTTQGAKLLSVQSNASEKFYIDKDGNLYAAGTILSGNGNGVLMTNKSGGTVAVRGLVIIDTSNNSAFTTTTTAYAKTAFGVVTGVGLGVTNDANGDGVCNANDICMVAMGGEVNVTTTNASTASKGDYLYTSATAGSAVASAKQFDGLIGVVSSTANSGSGYLKMIFKVQPQVTAAASIDKGSKHNEYWLYANKYLSVGEGADVNANLLNRGLMFDNLSDTTKTDSANTTVSGPVQVSATKGETLRTQGLTFNEPAAPYRAGLLGGQTLATSTTDNAGNTYLGSNTVNKTFLYDRTRDSTPQVQVELGIDPNWYNGVTLAVATSSASFSSNSTNWSNKSNPNLSTNYNGSAIKVTGTYSSNARTIYITIKSPTTFDWTDYNGQASTGVTMTPGTAQTLTGTGVSATFTSTTRYNTGDVFKIASWFVEPSGSTRGTKQQFPERSYVVATASSVDIIDADTQKLWMRFSTGTNFALGTATTNTPNSVNVLNGKAYVAMNGATATGLYTLDFVHDAAFKQNATDWRLSDSNLAQRNGTNTYNVLNTSNILVNVTANDVSAAVIPNHPTQTVTVSGWGYIQGTGSTPINETFNFPNKFNNTPAVVVTNAGAISTTAPTKLSDCTGNNWRDAIISAYAITTTSAGVVFYNAGNFPTSWYLCYTWTATGQVSPRQFAAAATDAGVTVINETDATAYSYSDVTSDNYNNVALTSAGRMYALNETQAQLEKWRDIASNTATETNGTPDRKWDEASTVALTNAAPTIQVSSSTLSVTEKTSTIYSGSDTIYVGTNLGTSVIQDNETWPTAGDGSEESSGSVKYYTKDYISEEMVGDIRGMWPLSNGFGSGLSDASVKGNTLTNNGSTTFTATGVRGQAGSFNGSSQSLTSTNSTLMLATNFTAGVWVNFTATSNMSIMSEKINAVLGTSWAFGTGSQGIAGGNCSSGSAFTVDVWNASVWTCTTSSVTPTTGRWYYVVFTVDSSSVPRLYVDGQLVATGTAATPTNSDTFYIGRNYTAGYFNGSIDEPFVTATALTAGQIKHLYEVGYRALQSHATTLGGGAADTNQQLGFISTGTNTVGAVGVDYNNQFMYVGTNSTTLGAVSKIDLNSDTNIKTYNSSANVPTGGALLIDEDTKSLAVGYQLEAVGSAASGVKTMGVDNNATATSGNFIGKTVTTAESFTQAYLWAQYTLDSSDASNTVTVSASNDGGSNYYQCNLTNTDTSQTPTEYEYFCQFNAAGSSLKTKFALARGSTKTNTYVTRYGIAWIGSDALGGAPGGNGLYTNNNSSVANGSYIEVAHNQNSNDVVTNGWVYDTALAKWVQIDNSSTDATGGTITYSGGYTIHTFTSSGTFTPPVAGNVEYLVVGGGGGGGADRGGGGGAGGFITATGLAVTAQGYTVTVGAGGAAGTNGNDSVFSTITATGGGRGGTRFGNAAAIGGSGGGGADPSGSGAAGTSGQGSAGGNGASNAGGGGGGKNAVGTAATSNTGGAGGNGLASSISGSSATYAGGGGGGAFSGTAGAGGAGGGGGGATGSNNGTAGTANTGGGGGAGGDNGTGGAGGSGIVIIRYPTNSLASSSFKITQQDANTVRLYNYSGAAQNLRLDVITGGLGRNAGTVSLAPAAADVDSQSNVNSIWINKTGSGGNLLKLQTSGADMTLINNLGDITAGITALDGSTTANGAGTASTTLILTSATNFDVGNYVKVSSTNCVTGVNVCYAKITAIATNTLTISPALTWANSSAVVEVHVPELGGIDTSQALANRYGRGYFIDGIVTGNGSSYFTDNLINFGGGSKIQDASGKLQLQAGGTGTGSTGTGSIYFLNSSGTTKGRFDTSILTGATGGSISTASGYTIHTFTTTGNSTFTPNGNGNVDYLVVGGGGGGGSLGGGGGAGGFLTGTGFAVSSQAYTVTVGVGGNGGSTSGSSGNAGGNSVFSTYTAVGGGGGGGFTATGGNGGSGGGGGGSGAAGGTATSGQGNNGGTNTPSSPTAAAGGGGASGVGTAGSTNNLNGPGGNGGAGSSSSISGSAVTYASGGGGGARADTDAQNTAGGTGGNGNNGGSSRNSPAAVAGTTNRGDGGGGGGYGLDPANFYPGANGGSGIVIIRYTTPPANNYGTLYLGSTNTSSADLAEYYVSGDGTIEAGDVVMISQKSKVKSQNGEDIDTKGVLMKADKPYDSKLIGIISTNPGVVMGSIDGDTGKEDKRMLALAGRVPVKIDPESPPIEVGDFLTSSDKPGLAQKATKAGYTVGKALESWNPGGVSTIEVFVNLGYYVGNLTAEGFLNQQKTTLSSGFLAGMYSVEPMPDLSSKETIASESGDVKTLEGVDLGGVEPPQPDLTGPAPHRSRPTPSTIIASASAWLRENWDSLSRQNTDLIQSLWVKTGILTADTLISPLAEIDTIYSSTISAETASISGTLYAANIESPTIDSLNTKYSILDTNYATASAILATIRAKYDSFDSLTAPESGPNATISGSPSLDTKYLILDTIVSDALMVNTSLISNSINSNDTALYLQPTANQPINLLAGLMTLTPDGQVVINGDLTVSGTLAAKTITTNDLIVASNSPCSVIPSMLEGSSSSAQPAREDSSTSVGMTSNCDATVSGTLNSNASIGTGTIASGSAEVKIENSKIKDSTYIYLTPISDTQNQVLYVKSKTSCPLQDPSSILGMTNCIPSFTVGVPATPARGEASPAAEILFNYWLIQTQ